MNKRFITGLNKRTENSIVNLAEAEAVGNPESSSLNGKTKVEITLRWPEGEMNIFI